MDSRCMSGTVAHRRTSTPVHRTDDFVPHAVHLLCPACGTLIVLHVTVTRARDSQSRTSDTEERHPLNVTLWNELMKAKGISGLREQARRTKVPPSTLSRLLEGENEAKLGTAIRLAKYAGVSVELLFPAAHENRAA